MFCKYPIYFLSSFPQFKPNLKIIHIYYTTWCKMFSIMLSLNAIHPIIIVFFFLFSMKLFLNADSNIFCYIDVNIITQMHASMNSSKDPWMFMLFDNHPSMKQQSVQIEIWTHVLSQEPNLEYSASDRSAILTLYLERQNLLFTSDYRCISFFLQRNFF